jgi:hypothetical protein
VTLAFVIPVLPLAVKPVVEYTLAVHPAAEPRASVTVTVPIAPLTVPPGVVVPPDRVADPGAAMDRPPAVAVNVTVVSAAFAGTAVATAIAATPTRRSIPMRFWDIGPSF